MDVCTFTGIRNSCFVLRHEHVPFCLVHYPSLHHWAVLDQHRKHNHIGRSKNGLSQSQSDSQAFSSRIISVSRQSNKASYD